MVNFGNLQAPRKDIAEYTVYSIVGMEPVLTGRHAGESHKGFFNEKLRMAEQIARRKAKLNSDLIKANRKRDKDLYARFIITGWKGVVDAQGAEVPFSVENCLAFFNAVDDDTFDGIREFFGEVTNFQTVLDSEGAVGNSQTA